MKKVKFCTKESSMYVHRWFGFRSTRFVVPITSNTLERIIPAAKGEGMVTLWLSTKLKNDKENKKLILSLAKRDMPFLTFSMFWPYIPSHPELDTLALCREGLMEVFGELPENIYVYARKN